MAKTISKLLGIIFILVGVLGFFAPGLGGAHLSRAHNIIHLVSGVIALYFGTAGSLRGAKAFCIVFGLVYLGLGLAGHFLGQQGTPTMVEMVAMPDAKLFVIIPGQLELGTKDHLLHIVIGLVFFFSGIFTRVAPRAEIS